MSMTVLYKKENNVSLKLQLYKLNIIVEIQRWFSGEMEKHTTAQLRSLILDQYSHENEDVNWVRDDILGTKIDTCVLDHQEIREYVDNH